ncbi:MAG TPA: hypothetical protein VNE41_01405 [Chitinophagaceae bacterium]|nr:hypothetical protein [Chitinophagaceae bacterium]
MMDMVPVVDGETARCFLQLPVELYRTDLNWIRPLDKDIREVFDPGKNKTFRHGECQRWILRDEAGKHIGRVAAFVNKKYRNKGTDFPVGGMGFFECIDDQQAANMLFDHCRSWLLDRGMEAMDGPVNFGERDRWWGLVVDGYHKPLYCMNYNPPYYRKLFENYGFRVYFNQVCFGMRVDTQLQEKYFTRHAQLASDPGFRATQIDKRKLNRFAEDFSIIYNKAWAGHGGNKSIERKQALTIFNGMKKVMDEKLVWYVYYKDEPIACWLNLPDLNEYFGMLNGKFGLLQKLRFLWMMKRGKSKKFVGLVFGIVPEFQGMGVDAYMIVEGSRVIQSSSGYEEYEMQWIGDFNPKMINIAESLGTSRNRTLVTYRFLFDRDREFRRHPMLS